MTISAAVIGASGYAGGEMLRLLSFHPEVRIRSVMGDSSAGRALSEVQPHLHSLAGHVIEPVETSRLAEMDAVFLALPHGASAPIARELPESVVVVDAGADFRLESSEQWERYYGGEHAGTWDYGLPELLLSERSADGSPLRQRERLAGARRISVPGCYPTSVLLALAPGFHAGILHPEDVVVVSASGTSGAGRGMAPHLLGSEVMGSMSPYGVGGRHRHIPEIEQGLARAGGRPVQISFTPTLAPMPRGILTTATARLGGGISPDEVRGAWEAAYADEEFVRLLPEGQWPTTGSVLGSNYAHLQLAVDERAGRVIVTAVIDNLTKGTAGGAVQSMNIALGLEERTGLRFGACAP